MPQAPSPGTLFVVATPIGNLEDITLRAIRVLREVVADRRGRHAAHEPAAQPFRDHHPDASACTSTTSTTARLPLVERLLAGESIALVTDAGTPLLSDPGHLLTAAAAARGIRVEPIPGPPPCCGAGRGRRAVEPVRVLGLYPYQAERAGGRSTRKPTALGLPFVVFEAPHRLRASLEDAAAVLVGAPAGRRPGTDEDPRGVRPDDHDEAPRRF